MHICNDNVKILNELPMIGSKVDFERMVGLSLNIEYYGKIYNEIDDNCSLKEIAKDITGCTGHSVSKELRKNEVVCWKCGNLVDEERAFQDRNYENIWICFNCY